MDFPLVQAQLNDLPSTFKRQGNPYGQIIDALTAGLYLYTQAADSVLAQGTYFPGARFGWLDTWGLLVNVPRQANEADLRYAARILYTVTAGAGSPVGIALWIYKVWNLTVTITENLPDVGYTITFPGPVSSDLLLQILESLDRIRPAGVPFIIGVPGEGLFANTINFFNAVNITGAYLTTTPSAPTASLSPATNNIEPSLPEIFLIDPVLNPGLAVA